MEKEKVLVVGTGKSGIAATQLLLRTGKLPVLFDSNAELDKDEILGKLSLSGDEKKRNLPTSCGDGEISICTKHLQRKKRRNFPVLY